METIRIEGYYLAEFCQKIEPLLNEGWKFDFESNEGYPTSFGSFFSAALVRPIQVLEEIKENKAKAKSKSE